MGKRLFVVCSLAITILASAAHAKDLGDVLLKKGLITEDELKQAREEDKQKSAAAESKVDAVMAKLPKWLDMITPFGDLRNRVEGFYGDNYHAQTRYRIRARLGLTANVTDEISGTFRLVTGDPNDPISTNQTESNVFTRKSVNVDWAFVTLKPGKTFGLEPGWGQVVLGKFPVMLARESEMIWDDDLSPEGASETLNVWEQRDGFLRSLRLNALQWEVSETSTNNDSWIAGGQAVLDTAIGSTATWSASLGDYNFLGSNRVASTYLSQYSGSASAANCTAAQLAKDPTSTCYATNGSQNTALANSNSVRLSGADSAGHQKITGYVNGFNVINAGSELNFPNPIGVGIPAGIFADYANNTEASGRNNAVTIGLGVGKAQKDWYHNNLKNPGDWGVSYLWEWVEKDAVPSLFSYSDFYYQQVTGSRSVTQKGSTNVTGSIIRGDYELFQNFQLTAKFHFINALDPGIATFNSGAPTSKANSTLIGSSTLTRMQLDAVFKF